MIRELSSTQKNDDCFAGSALALTRRFLLAWVLLFSFNLSFANGIELEQLSQEILARTSRVDCFDFIAHEAQKLGVKVYLFGGSAAAYAHYVHWDLLRESGDKRFHPDRFSYAYVDIFRSNQDMDIVLDGDASQAQVLEKLLAEKFPFFQGNKSVWEVRLLRTDRGDKQALLNNPDFLNQHTDSNSTGLIELSTDPNKAQIRDLRDWQHTERSQFLQDVQARKLHYYYSELHHETSRFKQGMNPPIMSVIRYLIKAFQYELTIEPEALAQLKVIIDDFDYNRITNDYVKKWINNNGIKLYQNAVNLEYASNVLDELRLKQKLIKIGDVHKVEDLAWWMNKQVLPSYTPGQGAGKTALELGIDFVAHETNSFSAWESITKSHENTPNVFMSRSGGNNESASFGDGFYTQVGRKGARGTGITIRFKLNPKARLGADFEIHNNGQYIVIKNKNALIVIQENLDWSPQEYFEKIIFGFQFDHSDKAVTYKLKQKINKKISALNNAQFEKLHEFIMDYFDQPEKNTVNALYQEWIELKVSEKYYPTPEQYIKAIAQGLRVPAYASQPNKTMTYEFKQQMNDKIKSLSELDLKALYKTANHYFDHPDAAHIDDIYREWLTLDLPEKYYPTLEQYAKALPKGLALLNLGSNIPGIVNYRSFLKSQLSRLSISEMTQLDQFILHEFQYKNEGQILNDVNTRRTISYLEYLLLKPHPENNKNLLLAISSPFEQISSALVQQFFSNPEVTNHPILLEIVTKGASQKLMCKLAQYTFSRPHQYRTDLIKFIVENGESMAHLDLVKHTFSRPHAAQMQDLIKLLIERADQMILAELIQHVFSKPHTQNMEEALIEIIKKSNRHNLHRVVTNLFAQPHIQNMHQALQVLIERSDTGIIKDVVQYVFSQPYAERMQALIDLTIEKGDRHVFMALAEDLFSKPHARPMQAKLKLVIEKAPVSILAPMLESILRSSNRSILNGLLKPILLKADLSTLDFLKGLVAVLRKEDQIPELKNILDGLKNIPREQWIEHLRQLAALMPDKQFRPQGQCLRQRLSSTDYL